MTFKNQKEEKRVTSIMERIRPIWAETVEPGYYGRCRVETSRLFEKRLGKDAKDIACLTALYLYDLGEGAPKCAQFAYKTLQGEEIVYCVDRDDVNNIALFRLQEE